MKPILSACILSFSVPAIAAAGTIPAGLVGEWRSPHAHPPYDGLHIQADGATGFTVAGDDGKVIRGGKGTATYDAFRRTLTISFTDSAQKLFRFRYNERSKTLSDQARPTQSPYKRNSNKVPDFFCGQLGV